MTPDAPTSTPLRRAFPVVWRVLAMVVYGGVSWFAATELVAERTGGPMPEAAWLLVADPVIGVAAIVVAVTLFRRQPLLFGALILASQSISTAAMGAACYVVVSISTQRRWRQVVGFGLLAIASGELNTLLYLNFYQPSTDPFQPIGTTIGSTIWVALMVAIGLVIGYRREVNRNWQDRVRAAEEQQIVRAEAARVAERNRIAREMHDVLAHRISLVAMHAGVLSYRRDLSPEEQAAAAQTIADNAHLALEELRDVLGVLRADQEPGAIDRPQPRLADLPELIEESRQAGVKVRLDLAVSAHPAETVGRTVYRVVQEALTNARKHAPGAAVQVSVVGDAEAGIRIKVTNPVGTQPITPLPSSGMGLLGLRERVGRLEGRLEVDETPSGFRLEVWLPWTP